MDMNDKSFHSMLLMCDRNTVVTNKWWIPSSVGAKTSVSFDVDDADDTYQVEKWPEKALEEKKSEDADYITSSLHSVVILEWKCSRTNWS